MAVFSTHQEIKATVLWLVLAFLLTCAGFWQAKVAVASDLAAKHRQLPPPAKTKHALRPPPAVFTGDVVADYIARCEKGMTDQEIRWILEDFHQFGPSQRHPWDNIHEVPPNSSHSSAELEYFLAYTRAQTRWYRGIFRDGLRLSPEQSAEFSRNLARQLEKSQTTFLGLVKNGFPKSDIKLHGGKQNRDWTDWSQYYLGLPECRPWNLCSLTSAQEKISGKLDYQTIDSGEHSHPDPYPFDARLPTTENREFHFYDSNLFLPFLKNQKLVELPVEDPFAEPGQQLIQEENSRRTSLENTRHLHPAQLKTTLLFNPWMADELQQALDAESH